MFSDPVSGKDFFGRQDVLDVIAKRVGAFTRGYRQNIALIGHQKLGKTSILHHFLYQYNHDHIVPIYVEIKPQALEQFVDQFIRSLLYQFLRQKMAVNSLESFQALVQRARTLIPETTREIDAIVKILKQGNAETAYTRVFELTSRLHKETGKQCVVMLDEFHRLGDFAIKNAFHNFGKRIMVQKETLYILSSSSFHVSCRILAEKLSLLFGSFERIFLEPFSFETSNAFLDTRLAPIEISEHLKKYIIYLTDGHPFYLNVISRELRHTAALYDKIVIDDDIVVQSLKKLLFESPGILNHYFLNLTAIWRNRIKGNHMLILIKLSQGVNKSTDLARTLKRSRAETTRQLKELIDEELIVKSGVFYHFHDNLLQFWLRYVYQPREYSLLVDMNSKSFHFCIDCRQHLLTFLDASQMSPTERVMNLFKCFHNELVELDSKGRYMPQFQDVHELTQSDSTPKAILAKSQSQAWFCRVNEECTTERDVVAFLKNAQDYKKIGPKKMLVNLQGMEQNARLLAKNKKIWTLNLHRVNKLLDFYGQSKIIAINPTRRNAAASDTVAR